MNLAIMAVSSIFRFQSVLTMGSTEDLWSELLMATGVSVDDAVTDATPQHDFTTQAVDVPEGSTKDSLILNAITSPYADSLPQVTSDSISSSPTDVTESISSTTEPLTTVAQLVDQDSSSPVDGITTQPTTSFTSIWDLISESTGLSTSEETTLVEVTNSSIEGTETFTTTTTDYELPSNTTFDFNATTLSETTSDLATDLYNATTEASTTFESTFASVTTEELTSSGNMTSVMKTVETLAGNIMNSTSLSSALPVVKAESHGLSSMQIWFLVTGCFIGTVIILMFLNCLIEHRVKLGAQVKKMKPPEEIPRVSRVPTPPKDDDEQIISQTHMFQRHFLRKK